MSSNDPPQFVGRVPVAASQDLRRETSGPGRTIASAQLTPSSHQVKLPITATFRFMDMIVDIREIREIIYGLIFRDMKLRRGSIPPISMSIIFASKACYAEARPILLSEATFHVRPTGGMEPYMNASNLPLALKDFSTLRHIQLSMPDVGSSPQAVRKLIASLPNLQSVDCHFIPGSGPDFNLAYPNRGQSVQVGKNGTMDAVNLGRVEQVLTSTIPRCLTGLMRLSWRDIHEVLRVWQSCGRTFELTLVSRMHAEPSTFQSGDGSTTYEWNELVSASFHCNGWWV